MQISLHPILTVKELAEYLRIHPATIYKMLRRGEMPAFRIGTDWRFVRDDIDRWLELLSETPGEPSNLRGSVSPLGDGITLVRRR